MRHEFRRAGSFEQFKVFAVALLLQLVDRDKSQGCGVHAISQTGRLRTVIENVPKVRVALRSADLCAFHAKSIVIFPNDGLFADRSREAWPAGAGLKFVF